MRDDTLYTIGYDRKWHEEQRVVLAAKRTREAAEKRRERLLGIAGLLIFAALILGLCACVAGIAGGWINIF